MPSGSRQKKSTEAGTVLVRQAQPKYNFQGKKLPRETPSKTNLPDEVSSNKQNFTGSYITNNGSKPMAVVGASYQGKAVSQVDRLSATSHLTHPMSTPDLPSLAGKDSLQKEANSGDVEDFHSVRSESSSAGDVTSGLPSLTAPSSVSNLPALLAGDTSSGAVVPVVGPTALSTQVLHHVQSHFEQTERMEQLTERTEQLEREKEQLRRDLDVQLQVNGELKKLLVASVGEDLSVRMERLARDRAELTQDLGGFNKKMDEDYENFDKVSIQADMWRSKYLASRVMVEELGNARAYYALQLHDSHDALQQMLNERHELRTNLLENYKVMQQVKNAFDPLNTQRSTFLTSTNVLDLSRACQQLSESVRFRLLPANVAVPVGSEGNDDIWENCVTRAEQFAHQVLSRPSEPGGCLASGSSRLLPVTSTNLANQPINRFHPNQKHENLTFNCTKCKNNEIYVL